jgi:hypothetical protein
MRRLMKIEQQTLSSVLLLLDQAQEHRLALRLPQTV